MPELSILDRQLHTFKVDELHELRRISDTIFEPLMRPFRQKRTVNEFSFKKSIRLAQRTGYLMPAYDKVEREHRKSRLIIAMSLAGIDRCSAVSLIPLLSCLKESSLDFKFYIYTDDMVLAQFTPDGFLANDHLIAWNHVSGPNVMTRLAELETDVQEDMLLIIDSLGGGASRWFEYWGWEEREGVKKEQDVYLSTAGRYGFYTRLREQLAGDYRKIGEIKKLPNEWLKKVESNTTQRWMETPALEEYMMRWVFNPKFGENRHGDFYISHQSAYDVMHKLRGKFRQIHLLTPNNQGSHRNTLERVLRQNIIDYHHQANTIYGFATVLSNIVHGQCPFDGPFTKKVSYEIVKFGEYTGEDEDDVIDGEEGGEGNHTQLKPSGVCFNQCSVIAPSHPDITTLKVEKRLRGTSSTELYELPLNEVDLSEVLPEDISFHQFWRDKVLSPEFEIERGDSEYTRLIKAEEVLETVCKYHIVYKKGYGHMGLVREKRPVVSDAAKLQEILDGINYENHNTRSLRSDTEEILMMVAPAYHNFLHQFALKHVIWCTNGVYCQERRAFSVNPKDSKERKREVVFHECGHYLESTCPPLGAFTNELLKQKCGLVDKKKLIQVGTGEYAMPVTNGTPDWIKPYAGKWYVRKHPNLPNETEVVSVHMEYFSSKEKLVQLIRHDPNIVRFMAFVIMGGPVAAMHSVQDLKKRQALQEISQRDRKVAGMGRGRGGYRGGGGGRRSSGGGNKPKNQGFGF